MSARSLVALPYCQPSGDEVARVHVDARDVHVDVDWLPELTTTVMLVRGSTTVNL